MDTEKDAAKDYEDMGIEFEEAPIAETTEETTTETPAPVVTPPADDKDEKADDQKTDDQTDDTQDTSKQEPTSQERKPRSIYQDLKETRGQVKTERELRETAERERDDLKKQFEDKGEKTVDQDIQAYAAEIGADPEALQRMRDIFLKDLPKANVIPPELQENMAAFTQWQADQGKANEATIFNQEFQAATPTLKQIFQNVSDDDMTKIKAKVDELAHTAKYADKDLDYVIFKEQEALKPLVSPKKPGIESKGRVDGHELSDTEFDPNADISKMTPKQAEEWENAYLKLSKSPEGLMQDGRGKKILI